MAVYTHVDRPSLDAFLADYDLPALTAHHGIEAGVENTNYLLETEGPKLILTLFEKRVKAADLPFFLDLTAHLADAGLNVPAPVADREGRTLKKLCGRPATIVTFLEGESVKHANTARARAAGALLARLHLAGRNFGQSRPNDLGPGDWTAMASHLGKGLDRIAPTLHDELTEEARTLASSWPEDLPKGAIHADFFPDNVMFKGDEPTGVFDFYFACTDFFAYDLAVAMNAFTPETAPSPAEGEALREGYESVRPLTSLEVKSLPVFLRGAALRFALTRAHDWLHRVPGSLVEVKDPMPWVAFSRAHRQTPPFFKAGKIA